MKGKNDYPNTRKWPFFGKEAFPSPRSWYCITAYPEVLERKVSKGRELTLCFISGSLRVLEYPQTHMTSFFWGMWELCVGIEDRRGGGVNCTRILCLMFIQKQKKRYNHLIDGFNNKSTEQEAESQRIVGQSLLSRLQYPVPYQSRLQRIYLSQRLELRWHMMLDRSLSLYALHQERWISSVFSKDSDLEAFSHNPTDGSFAALAVQLTAFTNYLKQRFLSY